MSGVGDSASDANAPGDTLADIHRRNQAAGADIFSPAQGFNPDRKGLSGKVAADIAMNPFSDYATESEKAFAAAQVALPGGLLIGGLRALGMMGKVGEKPTPTDSYGGDNEPAPRLLKQPRRLLTPGQPGSPGQLGSTTTPGKTTTETRLSETTLQAAQDRRRIGRPLISGSPLGITNTQIAGLRRTLG